MAPSPASCRASQVIHMSWSTGGTRRRGSQGKHEEEKMLCNSHNLLSPSPRLKCTVHDTGVATSKGPTKATTKSATVQEGYLLALKMALLFPFEFHFPRNRCSIGDFARRKSRNPRPIHDHKTRAQTPVKCDHRPLAARECDACSTSCSAAEQLMCDRPLNDHFCFAFTSTSLS